MDIAIIGAGNVGGALTRAFTQAGHTVVVTSRDPEDSGALAEATGARLVSSNREAAEAGDIVVLAVPFASAKEIAAEIAEAVAGKPVIDVTNRMSFGENGPDIDTTTSNSEELAALLPAAHVVKAFNTLLASRQADPTLEGVRLDAYIAGDDAEAKTVVARLAESIGLRPVDVGPLARARQLEGLAFLHITLNVAHQGSWQSGWKLVGAPETLRTVA